MAIFLPLAILHLTAYILLLAALKSSRPYISTADTKKTWHLEYIGLWVLLLCFDMAWGVGLPAMHSFGTSQAGLRAFLQVIFIVLSFSLGLAAFVFFFVFSREIRQKWFREASRWFPCCPGEKIVGHITLSDTTSAQENLYSITVSPPLASDGGGEPGGEGEEGKGKEIEGEEEVEKVDLEAVVDEDGDGDGEGLYAVGSGEGVSDSEGLFANPLADLGSEDEFVADEIDTKL